jgi:hypothetical protein
MVRERRRCDGADGVNVVLLDSNARALALEQYALFLAAPRRRRRLGGSEGGDEASGDKEGYGPVDT